MLTYVGEQILPAEAGIDLLFASDVVVEPDVPAVSIRGRGLQRFIIIGGV